jgi:hypothetical protein
MGFSFVENKVEEKIEECDKKSFSLFSITINPNITLMDDKEVDLFRSAAKYFFSEQILPKYVENYDSVLDSSGSWQVEIGGKKKSNHIQGECSIIHTKGSKIRFKLKEMNSFWNKLLETYFKDRGERKVYIFIRAGTDYKATLQQYCKKKK